MTKYVDVQWLPKIKKREEVELKNKTMQWRRKNGIVL